MTEALTVAGFDHRCYVPVLITKRGEHTALRGLPAAIKQAMMPLLVVPPVDWDYELDQPAKSIDQHLAQRPRELRDAWGTAWAFIDLSFIGEAPMASGLHPLVDFTARANQLGLPLVPVVSIDRSPTYRQAAADVVVRDHRGICLRLGPSEWPVGTQRQADLNALMTSLGVTAQETDLILDIGSDVVAAPAISLTAANAELTALPFSADWRSLTVLSAGFPKGAGDFAKGMNYIDRADWQLYKDLVAQIGTNGRLPSFGDYVVAHPDPAVDVDPRMMQSSATLRYTASDTFLFPKGELFRGRGTTGLGAAAVPPIAQVLANDSDFLGTAHCDTDQWVEDVAAGNVSQGLGKVR